MPYHVVSRLVDSRNLMTTPEEARELAHIVLPFGDSYGLLLFGVGGDHMHSYTTGDRKAAGQLARAEEAAITLVRRSRIGFRDAAIFHVNALDHTEYMLDYTLGQSAKHGVVGDLLLESTNALDLLSFRLINPRYATLLKTAMPWVTRDDIAAHLGGYPEPGTDPTRLLDAALVVSGGLDIRDGTGLGKRTRCAAIRIASELGQHPAATAHRFGISRRTVQRALAQSDELADHAVRRTLGLVQRNAPDGFPERVVLPPTKTWARRVDQR